MCQQEVDWEESDIEEEESNLSLTEPTSTTDSRPRLIDDTVHKTTKPHISYSTSAFGRIIKSTRRYIEQVDNTHL